MKTIHTEQAPQAVGPYSQAVEHNDIVYTAGQIALKADGDSAIGSGIEQETTQVLNNLKAVLEAAGASLDTALKVNIYMTDLSHFNTVNTIYEQYFTKKPARATVQVAALPKGAAIEMDVIAAKQ